MTTSTDQLAPVTWPPVPIRTERLLLRESRPGDRATFIDLFTSPEVGTYIGGPTRETKWNARPPKCQAAASAASWSTSTAR